MSEKYMISSIFLVLRLCLVSKLTTKSCLVSYLNHLIVHLKDVKTMHNRFFFCWFQICFTYTNCFVIHIGIETLSDYRFRYGRNPLLELPLAINPSGCARCEGRRRVVLPGKLRSHIPRSFTSSHGSSLLSQLDLSAPPTCPYSKHFVHSKSSQYKKMKQEWRNNVYLAR